MKRFFNGAVSALAGILFLCTMSQIRADEPKLGDASDGSRSRAVHLIDLYDDDGMLIRTDDKIPMPFSTKQTCLECHDYDKISTGWHFNAGLAPGRRGEPWIVVDPVTATQVPVSHRDWSGVFEPERMELTPFVYVQKFGRHLPGGGVCENDSSDSSETYLRWMISGRAEINCLACHDAEPQHDQTEYAKQIVRQNFRWAATATSGIATVSGSARDMPEFYDIYSGSIPDIYGAFPPTVEYDKSRFNRDGKVFFDIVRDIPEERCYFCHSHRVVSHPNEKRWSSDEDVHLTAGMTCVDCHRNGLNHDMVRGYEWEADVRMDAVVQWAFLEGDRTDPISVETVGSAVLSIVQSDTTLDSLGIAGWHSGNWTTFTESQKVRVLNELGSMFSGKGTPVYIKENEVYRVADSARLVKEDYFDQRGYNSVATLSCAGCHTGVEGEGGPNAGRLGAPHPVHKGLPTVHFEKLSCTACHSGPWPEKQADRVQTSRTHGLGAHGILKGDEVLPYVQSPVYVKDADGKIAPHHLIWPSYWALSKGDTLSPLVPEEIRPLVLSVIQQDSLTDSLNIALLRTGSWAQFSEKQIAVILDTLATLYPEKGEPVFIAAGNIVRLADSTAVTVQEAAVAEPYTWAFAHDVRPAEQSLGVRGCGDCHSVNSAFSFGDVKAPTSLGFAAATVRNMTSFQGLDSFYPRVFALTFLFRPLLKKLILACCFVMILVVIVSLFHGVDNIVKVWAGPKSKG